MQAINDFYSAFSAQDWTSVHGADWTQAEAPYHLYTFNRAALDGFGVAIGDIFHTSFKTYNAWNDENLANRPNGMDGPGALKALNESYQALLKLAQDHGPAARVHLPFIFNNGPRRLDWALYYLTYHKWFHLREAQLHKQGAPTELPVDTLRFLFGHQMLMMPAVLTAEDKAGLDIQVVLNIKPVGEWTISFADGLAAVTEGAVASPDLSFSTDYITYMKANFYGMQNPILAMLFGKMKVRGLSSAGKFQKLYAVWPEREWQTHEMGRPNPVEAS